MSMNPAGLAGSVCDPAVALVDVDEIYGKTDCIVVLSKFAVVFSVLTAITIFCVAVVIASFAICYLRPATAYL